MNLSKKLKYSVLLPIIAFMSVAIALCACIGIKGADVGTTAEAESTTMTITPTDQPGHTHDGMYFETDLNASFAANQTLSDVTYVTNSYFPGIQIIKYGVIEVDSGTGDIISKIEKPSVTGLVLYEEWYKTSRTKGDGSGTIEYYVTQKYHYDISGGTYYLSADLNFSQNYVNSLPIYVNGEAKICLNGHTLTLLEDTQFEVMSGGITLCGCDSDGDGVRGKVITSAKKLIYSSDIRYRITVSLQNVDIECQTNFSYWDRYHYMMIAIQFGDFNMSNVNFTYTGTKDSKLDKIIFLDIASFKDLDTELNNVSVGENVSVDSNFYFKSGPAINMNGYNNSDPIFVKPYEIRVGTVVAENATDAMVEIYDCDPYVDLGRETNVVAIIPWGIEVTLNNVSLDAVDGGGALSQTDLRDVAMTTIYLKANDGYLLPISLALPSGLVYTVSEDKLTATISGKPTDDQVQSYNGTPIAVTVNGKEDVEPHIHDGITFDRVMDADLLGSLGTGWDETTSKDYKILTAGNYFLNSGNVSLTADIRIFGQVNICLNGNNIVCGEYRFVLAGNASLNIYGCNGGAFVKNGYSIFAYNAGTSLGVHGGNAGRIVTVNPIDVSGYTGTVNVMFRNLTSGTTVLTNGTKDNLSLINAGSFDIREEGGNVVVYVYGSVTITLVGIELADGNTGALVQTNLLGAMTPVIVKASDGKFLPDSVSTKNGIVYTKNEDGTATISGTPSGDVSYALAAFDSADGHVHDGVTFGTALTLEYLNNCAGRIDAGNYYLAEDITWYGSLYINDAVNICLNGNKFRCVCTDNIIYVGSTGTLGIYGCCGGELTNSDNSYQDLFYVEGKFNLFGGTVSSIREKVINLTNGASFTMTGGSVINNYTSTENINIEQQVSVYANSGSAVKITNGTVKGKLYVWNAIDLDGYAGEAIPLYNGNITTGCVLANNAVNADVISLINDGYMQDYVADNKTIIAAGAYTVTINLVNAKLASTSEGALYQKVKVGEHFKPVKLDILGNYETASFDETYFNFNLSEDGTVATIMPTENTVSYPNQYYIKVVASIPHKHNDITFTALNSDEVYNSFNNGGNYYLTSDVYWDSNYSAFTVRNNLSICLNGYSITIRGMYPQIMVADGATLRIFDCDESGKGSIQFYREYVSDTSSLYDTSAINIGYGLLEIYGGTFLFTYDNYVIGGINVGGMSNDGGETWVYGNIAVYGGNLKNFLNSDGYCIRGNFANNNIKISGGTLGNVYVKSAIEAEGYDGNALSVYYGGISNGVTVLKNSTVDKLNLLNDGCFAKQSGTDVIAVPPKTVTVTLEHASATDEALLTQTVGGRITDIVITAEDGYVLPATLDIGYGLTYTLAPDGLTATISGEPTADTTITVTCVVADSRTPVDIPSAGSKDYTGETLISDLVDTELYTVTTNAGGIVAGEYDVVLTLKDNTSYRWATGDADDAVRTIKFVINKATNEWTTALDMADWTYGTTASDPVAEAKFGTVVFTYATAQDGTYSNVKPVNAGTYRVKATVEGTDNYTALIDMKSFVIATVKVAKPVADTTVFTYDGTEKTYTVAANDAYTVSGNKQTNAGTHTVTVTLNDKDNYEWADNTTADVTFDFVINKANVEVPSAGRKKYTGSTLVSDLADTELYTVTTNEGGTEAGEYDVVLTLVDSGNYKWVDGTETADKTVKFVIYKAYTVTITTIATLKDGSGALVQEVSEGDPIVDVILINTAHDGFAETNAEFDGTGLTYTRNSNGTVTISGTPVKDVTVTITMIHSHDRWTFVNYLTNANFTDFLYNVKDEPAISGAYCLAEDITITEDMLDSYKRAKVYANDDLALCLNGHTITVGARPLIIDFYDPSKVFSIYDCSDEATGKITGSSTSTAGGMQASSATVLQIGISAHVEMYGGTIENTGTSRQSYAVYATGDGVFGIHGGSIVVPSNANYSIVSSADIGIYGGSIGGTVYATGTIDANGYTGDPIKIKYNSYTDGKVLAYNNGDINILSLVESFYGEIKVIDNNIVMGFFYRVILNLYGVEIVPGEGQTTDELQNQDDFLRGPIKPVTVKAKEGFILPETIDALNGISYAYDAETKTAVISGTPTEGVQWIDYTIRAKLTPPTVSGETGYSGEFDNASHDISITASHVNSSVTFTYTWYKVEDEIRTLVAGTYSTLGVKNVPQSGTYICQVIAKAEGCESDPVDSAPITVSITPLDYDIAHVTFESATVVYDGQAHSLTITGDLPKGIDGEWLTVSYTGSATSVSQGAVTVTATFATDSVNYNVPEAKTATITITQATNEWTATLVLDDLTYGSTFNPTASAKFGEVVFAYATEENGVYESAKPVNAGTYWVKATVAETADYTGLTAKKSFVIDTVKVAKPEADSTAFTYDGTEKTYTVASNAAYSVSNNTRTLAGSQTVTVALHDKDNYEWTDGTTTDVTFDFVIAKAVVDVPSAGSKEYTGSLLQSDIADTADYTVTKNDGGTSVGYYDVVVELIDNGNYKWNDDGEDVAERTIQFRITKKLNRFTVELSMDNWTYSETAKEPSATALIGTVAFTYSNEENGTYSDTKPSAAGTYWVKATVAETADYTGLTAKKSFVIDTVKVTKPAKDTSVFSYNGAEQTYVVAANDAYTVSGNKQTNAGNHTVTIALIDKNNYEWTTAGNSDDLTYAFNIGKIDYDMSGITFENGTAEYDGQAHSLTITGDLPKGIDGEWLTVSYTGSATSVSQGAVTVTATFATDSLNYNVPEVKTATITITQATNAWTTSLDMADWTYGTTASDPVAEAKFGTVVFTYATAQDGTYSNVKPVNAGTYWVKATVAETADYTGLTAKKSFVIDTVKVTKPAENTTVFTYNKAEQTYAVTPNADYTVSNNKRTNAGSQIVSVALNDKDNYVWADGTTTDVTFTFTINKAAVEIPSAGSKDYTGERLISDLVDTELYVVTTNNGGTNAGEYDVLLTLADDDNYKWVTGNADDAVRTIKFVINKATNEWTTALDMADWTYGTTASDPVAEAKFGTLVFTYATAQDGTYSNVKPVNAGTYWVKATVEGTDNYTALIDTKSFVIATVKVAKPVADTTVFTYDGTEKTYTVAANDAYTVSGNKQTNAGTHTVTVTLNDKDNYEWADNTTADVEFTFTINKAQIAKPEADSTVFTYNKAEQTYAVAVNALYTVSNDKRTNAGSQTVTVALIDADNYEWADGTTADVEFTFTINKAVYDMSNVTFADKSIKVDGNAQNIVICGTLPEGVTVRYEGNGKTEPGVYTVTAIFTGDADNYEAIANKTATLTVLSAGMSESVPGNDTDKPDAIIESDNGFDPNFELVVEEITTKESVNKVIKKNEVIEKAYEVTLKSDGVVVQPDGTLTVKLLLPETLRGKEFRIISSENGENLQETEYTIEGDYVVFTTDRIAEFSFVSERDDASSLLWLIILLSILLLLEILLAIYKINKDRKDNREIRTYAIAPFVLAAAFPQAQVIAVIVLAILDIICGAYDAYLYLRRKREPEED